MRTMSEKNKTVTSAMLMILGHDLDPDAVTQVLDIVPSQAWRKGENHKRVKPNGAIEFYDTVYPWGGWKLWASEELKQMKLEAQLDHWLQVLNNRSAEIKRLKEQGNEIIINCFLATKSYLIYLPSETQAQFVEMGVDLEISVSNSSYRPNARERRRALRRRLRGR